MIEIKTCSQREPCWTRSRRSWPRQGGGRMSSSDPGWLTSLVVVQYYNHIIIWYPLWNWSRWWSSHFCLQETAAISITARPDQGEDSNSTELSLGFCVSTKPNLAQSNIQTSSRKQSRLSWIISFNQINRLINFWICDKHVNRFFQRGQRRPSNTAQNQTPKKRWLHIFIGRTIGHQFSTQYFRVSSLNWEQELKTTFLGIAMHCWLIVWFDNRTRWNGENTFLAHFILAFFLSAEANSTKWSNRVKIGILVFVYFLLSKTLTTTELVK